MSQGGYTFAKLTEKEETKSNQFIHLFINCRRYIAFVYQTRDKNGRYIKVIREQIK
jgi:hypothetical protein